LSYQLDASKGDGHYIAFLNHDGQWTKYDDDIVTSESEYYALEAAKQGYYFVYKKEDSKIDTKILEKKP